MKSFNIYYLLRVARNMKVKELAEKLYVTPSYINLIEKGEKTVNPRLRHYYAEALDIDEEVIKCLEEKSESKKCSYESLLLYLLTCIVKDENIKEE